MYARLFHMKLRSVDIDAFISNHLPWRHVDGKLVSLWSFDSFEQVRQCVEKLCALSEELQHHPTVTFGYNFIRVETTTHDADNQITEKDLMLASAVCELMPTAVKSAAQ